MGKALRRAFLATAAFLCGFLASASYASADVVPSYGAEASARVAGNYNTPPDLSCFDSTGGAGFASATAGCITAIGKAKGTIDMGSGAASVSVYTSDEAYYTEGIVNFNDSLTISGTALSGELTWTVSGISGNGFVDILMGAEDVEKGASCRGNCGPDLSVSVPVGSGAQVGLLFLMSCSAFSPDTNCTIRDGMSLTLSPGLSYTSAYPGFLSGTTPTPEPTEFTLCAIGLLALVFARRRRRPALQE
jgi:hypothetical protein